MLRCEITWKCECGADEREKFNFMRLRHGNMEIMLVGREVMESLALHFVDAIRTKFREQEINWTDDFKIWSEHENTFRFFSKL